MTKIENIIVNNKKSYQIHINEIQNHVNVSTYSNINAKNILHFVHVKNSIYSHQKKNQMRKKSKRY